MACYQRVFYYNVSYSSSNDSSDPSKRGLKLGRRQESSAYREVYPENKRSWKCAAAGTWFGGFELYVPNFPIPFLRTMDTMLTYHALLQRPVHPLNTPLPFLLPPPRFRHYRPRHHHRTHIRARHTRSAHRHKPVHGRKGHCQNRYGEQEVPFQQAQLLQSYRSPGSRRTNSSFPRHGQRR